LAVYVLVMRRACREVGRREGGQEGKKQAEERFVAGKRWEGTARVRQA
jgi:hypothetical protein